MGILFNLIAARCQNNGIGHKGNLPWSLKNEMNYFLRMTKEVKDPEKKNAVIMGRKTWDSLPPKMKPLPGRINFVLSRQQLNLTGAVLCSSFEELVKKINSPEFAEKIETAWIIGGSKVYKAAIEFNLCHRLYLTEILQDFECDTFLDVDVNKGFKEVSDNRVPKGIQEENDIRVTAEEESRKTFTFFKSGLFSLVRLRCAAHDVLSLQIQICSLEGEAICNIISDRDGVICLS